MFDDIVTRLRCNPCDCDGTCYTCQAADEIERLRAERDDLQVLLRGRTAEFQAEIERLREHVNLRTDATTPVCSGERDKEVCREP